MSALNKKCIFFFFLAELRRKKDNCRFKWISKKLFYANGINCQNFWNFWKWFKLPNTQIWVAIKNYVMKNCPNDTVFAKILSFGKRRKNVSWDQTFWMMLLLTFNFIFKKSQENIKDFLFTSFLLYFQINHKKYFLFYTFK